MLTNYYRFFKFKPHGGGRGWSHLHYPHPFMHAFASLYMRWMRARSVCSLSMSIFPYCLKCIHIIQRICNNHIMILGGRSYSTGERKKNQTYTGRKESADNLSFGRKFPQIGRNTICKLCGHVVWGMGVLDFPFRGKIYSKSANNAME